MYFSPISLLCSYWISASLSTMFVLDLCSFCYVPARSLLYLYYVHTRSLQCLCYTSFITSSTACRARLDRDVQSMQSLIYITTNFLLFCDFAATLLSHTVNRRSTSTSYSTCSTSSTSSISSISSVPSRRGNSFALVSQHLHHSGRRISSSHHMSKLSLRTSES